jgi:CheY-like chemotaxis protein
LQPDTVEMRQRILLVEDNPDNLNIYRTLLIHYGYEVLEAGNGALAIRLARESQPDLILMDIAIPVIDGWEATRQLKADERTRSIPIIALTARALDADREMAVAVGCDAYLAKPIEPKRVAEEVERFLGPRSAKVGGSTPAEGPHGV